MVWTQRKPVLEGIRSTDISFFADRVGHGRLQPTLTQTLTLTPTLTPTLTQTLTPTLTLTLTRESVAEYFVSKPALAAFVVLTSSVLALHLLLQPKP